MLLKYVIYQKNTLGTVSRDRYKSSVIPYHRHHNILPDTAKSWRWAKIKSDFYYDLDRIPNRNPTCYRDRFGDVAALHKSYKTAMKESFESNFDTNLLYYVKSKYEYFLNHYIEHQPEQRAALAKACAVFTYAVILSLKIKFHKLSIIRDLVFGNERTFSKKQFSFPLKILEIYYGLFFFSYTTKLFQWDLVLGYMGADRQSLILDVL